MTRLEPDNGLRLVSKVTSRAEVELSLERSPVGEPAANEVVLRVEAAPIHPSDLGMMLAGADVATATASGAAGETVVRLQAPPSVLKAQAARIGRPTPVGNEGAGVVVAAGASPEAQALLGKTVAVFAGGMYAQYRTVKARDCLVLPADVTAQEGAACFVNPLTALGMVETMRLEGHSALVHTAAASTLGQMLVKLCRAEGVPLVNIVRSPQQVEMLRAIGAVHVCDSSSPTFLGDLTEALEATGATIAFDAVGGGKLAGQILACMEDAILAGGAETERYGSGRHKQVYIYGSLDTGPTEILRTFGMAWGIGAWLLTPFLSRVGRARSQALREQAAAGLKTIFAIQYTEEISLAEVLQPQTLVAAGRRATGQKHLVRPWG